MLTALDTRLEEEIRGLGFPVVTLILVGLFVLGIVTVAASFMVRFGR